MTVKLLTEQHLEFLSLKGGCTGSSESIHVKMPYCWKSHVAAQMEQAPYPRIKGKFSVVHHSAEMQANAIYSKTCHKQPLKKKTKICF